MMRPGREQEIIQLVQRLIDLLGSDEVAIDKRHTPKLYSRFLADVLAKLLKQKRSRAAREFSEVNVNATRGVHDHQVGHPHVFNNASGGTPSLGMYAAEHYDTPSSSTMDARSGIFPSPPLHAHPASNFGVSSVPSSGYPPPPPAAEHPYPPEFTMDLDHLQDYSQSHSYAQDSERDRPLGSLRLPPDESSLREADMMIPSMAALTDPSWWDHAGMPGFSWTTNPGAWPKEVDMTLGNRGYERVEGSVGMGTGVGIGGETRTGPWVHASAASSSSSFSARV